VDKLNNLAAFRGSSFSAANNGGKCGHSGVPIGRVCWFDETMVVALSLRLQGKGRRSIYLMPGAVGQEFLMARTWQAPRQA